MRIAVLAFGSRGDVQPMLALARGLKDAGADVVLGADATFESLSREQGVPFSRVEGNILDALNSSDGERALSSGVNPLAMARLVRRYLEPVLDQVIHDTLRATAGADALLLGGVAYYAGSIIADWRQIPYALAHLQPMQPTAAFPSPMLPLPTRKEQAHRNRLSYAAGGQFFWQVLRPIVNKVRTRDFGLKPWPVLGNFQALRRERILQLCGFSEHVLPRPSDWPDMVRVAGYWFLPPAPWEPPGELLDYIAAGPPPICVGFGSMRHFKAYEFTRAIVAAIESLGQRAIFLEGWGGIDSSVLPDFMLALPSAPHDWLFPRCAAVIHHGGAGTTAAVLRAGKPMAVVPFFGDQSFWAWRVEELGVAPESIVRDDLTASGLARVLGRVLSEPHFTERAAAVGASIRGEDGVSVAVRHLIPYFEQRINRQYDGTSAH